MRLKGRFEKHRLQVGLSAAVPLIYVGPEEKYSLADLISQGAPGAVQYEKDVLEFDLILTTDELRKAPARNRCYEMISAMPDEALPEVEEDLSETYRHYLAIAETEKQHPLLSSPRTVEAQVTRRLTT